MIQNFKMEPYTFLSNFYPCTVKFMGVKFPSAEHAYQACRCSKEPDFAAILSASTPAEAKRVGRQVKARGGEVGNWEETKTYIMYEIVRAKFFGNPQLAEKLLATEDQDLVEGNWWGDTFWGVCKGQGTNILGTILMIIRRELCERKASKAGKEISNNSAGSI